MTKPKPKIKKNCSVCGSDFYTSRSRQKMCSQECRYNQTLKDNQVRRQILRSQKKVPCKVCSTPFNPTKKNKIYCGQACHDIGRRSTRLRAQEKYRTKNPDKLRRDGRERARRRWLKDRSGMLEKARTYSRSERAKERSKQYRKENASRYAYLARQQRAKKQIGAMQLLLASPDSQDDLGKVNGIMGTNVRQVECDQCKADFLTSHATQRLCSDECRVSAGVMTSTKSREYQRKRQEAKHDHTAN